MASTTARELIETAYRRVVPLYSFDDRGRAFLLASAVPFEEDQGRFLITAAHACFDHGKPVPLFVYGEERPHLLTGLRGAWEYKKGQQPDLDVAVIALDSECANDLQNRHWFCAPADVGSVAPKTPGIHYLVAGYPASRNRKRPAEFGLPGRATAFLTGDVIGVDLIPAVDKLNDHHFGVELPFAKIPGIGGGEFHVPPPPGMSGGGVWRVDVNPRTGIAGRPRLVGIGIEFYGPPRVYVATRVQRAAPLAADLLASRKKGPVA